MTRRSVWRGAVLALAMVLGGVTLAVRADDPPRMTVKDVLDLKRMGFGDADIIADLRRSGAPPTCTPADLEELRKLGAGPELLDALTPKSHDDPVAAAIAAQQAGKSAVDQLREVTRTPPRQRALTILLPAVRAGVPASVVRALRGGPLSVDDLVQLAKQQAAQDEVAMLAGYLQLAFTVDAKTALALRQQGVPLDWIAALRTLAGAGPAAASSAAPPATVRPSFPPTPPMPVETVRHSHLGGTYRLDVPTGWTARNKSARGFGFVRFDPFDGASVEQDVPVFIAVSVELFSRDDALLALPTESLGPRLVQFCLQEFPLLRELADQRRTEKRAGHEYYWSGFAGKLNDVDDAVVGTVCVVRAGSRAHMLLACAREAERESHLVPCQRLLETFEPIVQDVGEPPRLAQPLDSADLTEKYLPSVVLVRAGPATGTGFFIREDGYLLTNHHVVWDDNTGKVAESLQIEWDEQLARRSLPARVIALFRSDGASLDQTGLDLALLKVEGRGFAALPLTTLANTRNQDPVLSLGFPKSHEFRTVSLSSNRGNLTRLNLLSNGRISSYFIDAEITHGNSGGPCINLRTGGVLGLNTFGGTGDMSVFRGVVPIETAIERFPQIIHFPAGAIEQASTAQRLELGNMYLGMRRLFAAEVEFRQVLVAEPNLPAALIGLAQCQFESGAMDQAAETMRQAEVFVRDRREDFAAMTQVCNWCVMEQPERCLKLTDRMLQLRPTTWYTHALRGHAWAKLGRRDNAYESLNVARRLLNKLSADADISLVEVALSLGDVDRAREVIEEARRDYPEHSGVILLHLQVLERSGREAEALAMCATLADRLFRSPDFQRAWGRLAERAGNLEVAHQAYEAAFKLFRGLDSGVPLDVTIPFGRLLMARNNIEDALATYREGLRTDPKSSAASGSFLGLAHVWAKAQNPVLAWVHAARAAALDPEEPEAKRLVASMTPLTFPAEMALKLFSPLEYPGEAVAGLIESCGTKYDIAQADLVELLRKGYPLCIIQAFQKSGAAAATPEAATPASDPGARVVVKVLEASLGPGGKQLLAKVSLHNQNPFSLSVLKYLGLAVSKDDHIVGRTSGSIEGDLRADQTIELTLELFDAATLDLSKVAKVRVQIVGVTKGGEAGAQPQPANPSGTDLVAGIKIEEFSPYTSEDRPPQILGKLVLRNTHAFGVRLASYQATALGEGDAQLGQRSAVFGRELAPNERSEFTVLLFAAGQLDATKVKRVVITLTEVTQTGAAASQPAAAVDGDQLVILERAYSRSADGQYIVARLVLQNPHPFPVKRFDFTGIAFDAQDREVARQDFYHDKLINPGERVEVDVRLLMIGKLGNVAIAKATIEIFQVHRAN